MMQYDLLLVSSVEVHGRMRIN
ncbi:hypothetical protein OIU79_007171 [Salix purpurea]|uniref:Uncharacterized protein n=1 Tax=Salix purpurea TaxID=77065 RepID=A0A9Q0Z308_SALPP|nr:hypothetical protein OIU79_007171 [Salix purpurea]